MDDSPVGMVRFGDKVDHTYDGDEGVETRSTDDRGEDGGEDIGGTALRVASLGFEMQGMDRGVTGLVVRIPVMVYWYWCLDCRVSGGAKDGHCQADVTFYLLDT